MTGLVFDIQRYAIHDGPGIRTTVYLKGCPLRCAWCHNPESQAGAAEVIVSEGRCIHCGACVEACPRPAEDAQPAGEPACLRCGACVEACPSGARQIAGRQMSVEEVLASLECDRLFYEESGGGITFSGGEPLMQPEFLGACLQVCRARGYHTIVDTCGHAPPETLVAIARETALFLYDVKLIDDGRHRRFTGTSNELILGNLRRLSAAGAEIWIRFPLIPDVNDDEANLAALAELVHGLPTRPPVYVLPFHRLGRDKYARLGRNDTMSAFEPPRPEQVAGVARHLREAGLSVHLGG